MRNQVHQIKNSGLEHCANKLSQKLFIKIQTKVIESLLNYLADALICPTNKLDTDSFIHNIDWQNLIKDKGELDIRGLITRLIEQSFDVQFVKSLDHLIKKNAEDNLSGDTIQDKVISLFKEISYSNNKISTASPSIAHQLKRDINFYAQKLAKNEIEKAIKCQHRDKLIKSTLKLARLSLVPVVALSVRQGHLAFQYGMGMRCRTALGLFTLNPDEINKKHRSLYKERLSDQRCGQAFGAFYYPKEGFDDDIFLQMKRDPNTSKAAFNRLEQSLDNQIKIKEGLNKRGLPSPDRYFGSLIEVLYYGVTPSTLKSYNGEYRLEREFRQARKKADVCNEILGDSIFSVYKIETLDTIAVVNEHQFRKHLLEQGVIEPYEFSDSYKKIIYITQEEAPGEASFNELQRIYTSAGRSLVDATLSTTHDLLVTIGQLALIPELFLDHSLIQAELDKNRSFRNKEYFPFKEISLDDSDARFSSELSIQARTRYEELNTLFIQVIKNYGNIILTDGNTMRYTKVSNLVSINENRVFIDKELFEPNSSYFRELFFEMLCVFKPKDASENFKQQLEWTFRQLFLTATYLSSLNIEETEPAAKKRFTTTEALIRAELQEKWMQNNILN